MNNLQAEIMTLEFQLKQAEAFGRLRQNSDFLLLESYFDNVIHNTLDFCESTERLAGINEVFMHPKKESGKIQSYKKEINKRKAIQNLNKKTEAVLDWLTLKNIRFPKNIENN